MADIPRIAVLDGTGGNTDPMLVLGYESRRQSSNVVHDIIGGGAAISLQRARARSGTLELLYQDKATAQAGFELLNRTSTFSFSENYLTGDSPLDMLFSVAGAGVSIQLDPLTRKRWIVTVEYQELDQ